MNSSSENPVVVATTADAGQKYILYFHSDGQAVLLPTQVVPKTTIPVQIQTTGNQIQIQPAILPPNPAPIVEPATSSIPMCAVEPPRLIGVNTAVSSYNSVGPYMNFQTPCIPLLSGPSYSSCNDYSIMDPTVAIKEEPNEVEDEQDASNDELMDMDNGDFEHENYSDNQDNELENHIIDFGENLTEEERIEKLTIYYYEKYNLKEAKIVLENCEKIWQTLQLIREAQETLDPESSFEDNAPEFFENNVPEFFENNAPESLENNDPESFENNAPESFENNDPVPAELLAEDTEDFNHQYHGPVRKRERLRKKIPEYRYTGKIGRRTYYCLTCVLEFATIQGIRDHATNYHQFYYRPKRMYTRTDPPGSVKVKREDLNYVYRGNKEKKESEVDEMKTHETGEKIPSRVTRSTRQKNLTKPESSNKISEPIREFTRTSIDTEKSNVQVKKKIIKVQCILCQEICSDIVDHMTGYHKVGCYEAIVAQCPIIEEKDEDLPTSEVMNNLEVRKAVNKRDNNPTPSHGNTTISQVNKSPRKRRRNRTMWTLPKKKMRIDPQNCNSNPAIKNYPTGPYKCQICLGLYKSPKTFNHHKRLHRIRGETKENFDPTKCVFKNSPLRRKKMVKTLDAPSHVIDEPQVNRRAPILNEPLVHHKVVVPYHDNHAESTNCDCGRSFRNYHTLYLHKVKCKRNSEHDNRKSISPAVTDGDSGIGISIKIKKNKNDSYEVVGEDSFNNINKDGNDESSSSKDDEISNDSGSISINTATPIEKSNDANNYVSETERRSKDHSILKIQKADDDDEEIDIEEDSTESEHPHSLDEFKNSENLSLEKKPDFQELLLDDTDIDLKQKIPSLRVLCEQVLEKLDAPYRCLTCSSLFENAAPLMDHAAATKHNITHHCPCGKKFKQLKYLNQHIKTFHEHLLECNYCYIKFPRVEEFNQHNCPATEGKPFEEPIYQVPCHLCLKIVDIDEPFDEHIREEHKNDVSFFYYCFNCPSTFDNPNQRRVHFNKEHGPYTCNICCRYVELSQMGKHKAYHEGLGFPCHLCRKAYTDEESLNQHQSVFHSTLAQEVVKCNICKKTLRVKSLSKHMAMHMHLEICKRCDRCYQKDEKKNDDINSLHAPDYPDNTCFDCKEEFISNLRLKKHFQNGICNNNKS